tara:strand:+ start:1606 stop:2514 length:909 start_codon:yes stop_codon:yes gene_type:complete
MDKVVLTVQDTSGGEGGLLGLALHPSFSKNRFFYLYYTLNKDGKTINRVHRYKLSPDSTNATDDKIILDDIPAARFHNGGRLRFGPDGMLYIGTGDARQPSLAQDKDSLAGKILRVTPEGDIPADNPWSGKAAYIIGIRNTQGFDWLDSKTMVVTDHGPSGEMVGRRDHDEVHIAKAGENLGWPNIYACESSEGLLSPLLTWAKAVPPGGAALYTGTRFPDWQGNLLIGALGAKHLHRVVFDAQRKLSKHEVYFLGDAPSGHGRLREVMMGPDGELYVTTSNCDGRGNCPKDKDHILRLTSK